jgi:hypothetical protein
LVAILAVPISRVVRLPLLRVGVVVLLTVASFWLVAQWNAASYQIIGDSSLGPVALGMTAEQVRAAGVAGAAPGAFLQIDEGAYAELNDAGIVTLLTADSSMAEEPPPWRHETGITPDSSVADFMDAFPGSEVDEGSGGGSVAWVDLGQSALMLWSIAPDKGVLRIGSPEEIAMQVREITAVGPPVTESTDTDSASGYGWDDAYADALRGCLLEAQRTNGVVSLQDEQFCEDYSASLANQYCTADSCVNPSGQ